jgi:hypothetical protein
MFDPEPKNQLERLEMLCDELMEVSGIAKPKTDLEVLAFLERALRRSRGSHGWLQRIETFSWRCLAPLHDLRIHKQIQLHRDLLRNLEHDHPATKDSLAHLDDLIFARTYGRTVEGPVKKMIRYWVSSDQLNRRDAVILITNNCLTTDVHGVVLIKDDRFHWPIGILNFLIPCLGSSFLITLLLFSSASFLWVVVGVTVICAPLAAAWWVFLRYTLHPHRLIPRVKRLLPKIQAIP